MKRLLIILIALLQFWPTDPASADSSRTVHFYTHPTLISRSNSAVVIKGTEQQIRIFSRWLDQIVAVPKGFQTLANIADSGHQLMLQHSTMALISAGRTQAPLSKDLTNGIGRDVKILFNTDIPDNGSHMVYDEDRQLIEYTAIQNLYHELAHAMHMMNGTWRYFDSEEQAIEEENVFRQDLAAIQGKGPLSRFGKNGVLIGDVNDTIVISEWFGPTIVERRDRNRLPSRVSTTGIESYRLDDH